MRLSLLVISATSVVVLSGCRTTKDILDDYERDISYGQYEHASLEVSEKAGEGGSDELFWQLHAASAKYLAADHDNAVQRFDLAEDIFAKNDQQSVFSQGVSGTFAMMTNDKVFPYSGGGQDRIFTCLYKAIDFGAKGDVAAMRTELNRAAQHQENWLQERSNDIEAANERMKKDAEEYVKSQSKDDAKDLTGTSEKLGETESAVSAAMSDDGLGTQIKEHCDFDPASDGRLEALSTKDYMNVYVQDVCGLFRWLSGSTDGQYFLRDASMLKPENAMLKEDLAAMTAGTRPKDSVWIFVEDGLCPRREEWRIDLPLVLIPGLNRYVMYAGMAFPTLKQRNAAVTSYSASANGQTHQLMVLEDIDRLLKTEYDVYMRGALAREITRTIVKAGVQIALGVVAENVRDDYTRIALRSSQIAAAVWAASVTAADIRSWTGLPKSVHACRIARPSDGLVTVNCGTEQVQVNAPSGNTMVFVRKTSSAAPSVVKAITFPN